MFDSDQIRIAAERVFSLLFSITARKKNSRMFAGCFTLITFDWFGFQKSTSVPQMANVAPVPFSPKDRDIQVHFCFNVFILWTSLAL
ncbi:hypothetical protein MTR_6g013230 [Medicago truncatula]|uniref:Uncharacterized protein n=1 Tax=Medicago truncatula TaxID=3880 RepID=G7KLD4_MEDTR|nr:hypothetical protein MTR_6g013230 [Medicago truncatula]